MSTSRRFSIADDLALAQRMTDIADAITLSRYQSLDLVIETKPDATPVTDADKAVERALRDILAAERPDDLVVGEEFGGVEAISEALQANPGAHYWVIDPIDGTKNFLRGIPIWATLIGLSNSANQVIAGVVSAPALSRRWYAGRGLGAHVAEVNALGRREKRINVSKVSQISDAQLAYSDLIGWGNRTAAFLDLQKKVWRTRGFGDFWSHMLVAEGVVDIAIEPSLSLWDMAALEIIVLEAGGAFTNLDGATGSHGGSLVSSNGAIHSHVLTELNK
jgi:histidinol-phosphatase